MTRSPAKLRMFRLAAALPVLAAGGTALAQTDTVSTAQIVANTTAAAPSCLSWRVSGTCFWLRCALWKCSVKTSMRVTHYNPDAVVSSFHDEATHPWSDWGGPLERQLRSAANTLVGAPVDSAGTRTRDDGRDRSKMYRDADVIGHPSTLLAMLGSTGSVPMLCPTDVRAFQPYLSSYTDALVWRAMLPIESFYLEALTPGMREIGSWPTNSWSGVYPRDGNVTQQHPVKAAAVLSQRAGDVATRSAQPHLYTPLPTGGQRMIRNYMVWQPPPLVERDISTGKWQMVSPRSQNTCEVFGGNDSILPVSWGDGRTSGTGGHAFNLWRPYSCCSRAGQVFLGAITF